MGVQTLHALGITRVLAGTLILIAALLLLFSSTAKEEEKTKGGGVIIVGPIPIVFGTNRESVRTILLLSLALTILLMIALVIFYLLFK